MDTQFKSGFTSWSRNWPDWFSLLLGLWMMVAPFVLGFGAYTGAMGAFIGFGVAIALFSTLALTRPENWEEGINVIVGLCLAVSPWLFNFATDRPLTTNALLVGIAVIALSVGSMMRNMPGDHWWQHHRGSR